MLKMRASQKCVILLLALFGFSFAIKLPKPTVSADLTAHSEVDNASLRFKKRDPPYLYYLSLNSSVAISSFNVGFGLLYSSDDQFTSQRVNQFRFRPSWKWGGVSLGDFSAKFSDLTLNGVPLYGAGIELSPKSLCFSLVSGRSKRASSDLTDFSYTRNLSGIKVGTKWLSLIVLKSKDDTLSVRTQDSVLPVTPQENGVFGMVSSFSMFKILSFNIEGAGSAHTRDLRSDTFYSKNVPEFVKSIYDVHYSTRADFAVKGGVRLKPKFFTLDLSFANIGPGFTSFGLPYLKNDSRKIRLAVSTRVVPKTELGTMLEREQDNLVKDKMATTHSDGIGFTLRFAPISEVSIASDYSRRNMVKKAQLDSFKLNSVNKTFSISPALNLVFWDINQNANILFTYQDYKNRAPFSQTMPNQTLTMGLSYSITPRLPVTFLTSFSQTVSLKPKQNRQPSYQNYGLTYNQPLLKNRLSNSFTIAYQPSTEGNNFSLTGINAYSLTSKDILNFNWLISFFFSSTSGGRDFSSQKFGLTYNRKIL